MRILEDQNSLLGNMVICISACLPASTLNWFPECVHYVDSVSDERGRAEPSCCHGGVGADDRGGHGGDVVRGLLPGGGGGVVDVSAAMATAASRRVTPRPAAVVITVVRMIKLCP